jgi:UDP-N-acetylmuramyl pentapeptide phosphotransferase/UDP-N-acetylglucosamine-1-phosphate transferase
MNAQGVNGWVYMYPLSLFALGLYEDIRGLLPALTRLALMVGTSVLLFEMVPDKALSKASVGAASWLIQAHPLVGTLISVLGLAFLVNSFNTADGANGLLGILSLCALMALVYGQGPAYANVLLYLAIGVAIFLIFNLILGTVFLGDGGAYFLGAAVGLALIDANNQGANLWWLLCIVFYPHVDLLWSMARRMKAGMTPFGADNEHLHNLLFKALRPKIENGKLANTATGVLIACTFGLSVFLVTAYSPGFNNWGTLYGLLWALYAGLWVILSRVQRD